MANNAGYVQLRRGLRDHIIEGRLSEGEAVTFMLMLIDADHRTGIYWGGPNRLCGTYGMNVRTARDRLEKLEQKGYIKRFPVVGKHGNHAILIHKYSVNDGVNDGAAHFKVLNADITTDYKNPVYEFCDDGVNDGVDGGVNGGAAHIRNNQEVRNKHHVETSPVSTGDDLLFGLTPVTPEPITPAKPEVGIALRVYQHYCRVMGRDPKTYTFTSLRQQKLRARAVEALAMADRHGLTGDEAAQAAERAMKLAVDRCSQSKFHMGENDRGRRYVELEKHIFASAEKFQEWLNQKAKGVTA